MVFMSVSVLVFHRISHIVVLKHVSLMVFHFVCAWQLWCFKHCGTFSFPPHVLLARRFFFLSLSLYFSPSTSFVTQLNAPSTNLCSIFRPTFSAFVIRAIDFCMLSTECYLALWENYSTNHFIIYKTLDQSIIIYLWRQSTITTLHCPDYLLKKFIDF